MTAEEMSEANLEIILKLTNVWPTLPEEKKIALSAVIGCSNVAISHTTMHTIISRLLSVTDVGPRTKSLFSQLLNAFAEKPTESPSDKNEHPHSVDTGFLDQIRTISLDEHMPIPLDDPRNEKFSNSVSGAKQYGDLKKKMKKEKKAKKREKLISRFNALPLSRQMAVLRQATEKIDRNFNLMERTDGKLLVTRQIVNFRQLRSAMKRNQKSREKSRSRSRSPAVVH